MKKIFLSLVLLFSFFLPVSAAEITSDYDDDFAALFVIWSNSNYGITFDTDKDVLDSYIIDFLYDYIGQNYITLEQFNSLMEKIELYYNSEHVLKLDNQIQALFKACLDYMVESSDKNLILANTTYTITDTGESDITEYLPSFQRIDPTYRILVRDYRNVSNYGLPLNISTNNGLISYTWRSGSGISYYSNYQYLISNSSTHFTDSTFDISGYLSGPSPTTSQMHSFFVYEIYSFNLDDISSDYVLSIDTPSDDLGISFLYRVYSSAEDRASFISNFTNSSYNVGLFSKNNWTTLDSSHLSRSFTYSDTSKYALLLKRSIYFRLNIDYIDCNTSSYHRFFQFNNYTGSKSVLNSDLSCSTVDFTDYTSDLTSAINYHIVEPDLFIDGKSFNGYSGSLSFSIGFLPSNISQNGNYYQLGQNLSSFSSLSDLVDSINLSDSYSVKYYGRYTDTELDLTDSAAIQNESNLSLNDSLNGNMSQKEINESTKYHSGLTDIFSQYIKPVDEFSSGLNLNKFDLPFAFKDAAQHSSEAVNNFFNLDFFQENSWVIPLLIAGLVLSILLR